MGRHSIAKPVNATNPNAVRGLALAGALGVIAGAGIPVAIAAPQSEAQAVPAGSANAAVTLGETETQTVENTDVQSVVLDDTSAGEWEIGAVAAEADLGSDVVEAEEPVVAPVRHEVPAAPARQVSMTAPAALAASGDIAAIAQAYTGTPYVWGGASPAGWDCSGFTSWVYAQVGIQLPRTSEAQLAAGTIISADQAQPGDIVYWPGHVGIYVGGGMHVAAQTPATGTNLAPLYGNPTFVRIGR